MVERVKPRAANTVDTQPSAHTGTAPKVSQSYHAHWRECERPSQTLIPTMMLGVIGIGGEREEREYYVGLCGVPLFCRTLGDENTPDQWSICTVEVGN